MKLNWIGKIWRTTIHLLFYCPFLEKKQTTPTKNHCRAQPYLIIVIVAPTVKITFATWMKKLGCYWICRILIGSFFFIYFSHLRFPSHWIECGTQCAFFRWNINILVHKQSNKWQQYYRIPLENQRLKNNLAKCHM